MDLISTYRRALNLLRHERKKALALIIANAFIALVLLAEPILFGRVIDALIGNQNALPIMILWTLVGLLAILASVVVAIMADRLAHRNRLAAMQSAFSQSISLPVAYHAETGSGTLVRTILAGSDALFATWLSLFREQIAAVVSVVLLIPVAFYISWPLALLLVGLAGLYALLNAYVVQMTTDGQSKVEQHHLAVAGRLGDAIGNVTVVQSFTRLSAETNAINELMKTLLAAQYPVLTWWGILTVLTRSAATITLLAILFLGSWLAQTGRITIGEIVSFAAFAGLLIAKLDVFSGFLMRVFMQAPTLQTLFRLLDTPSAAPDRTDAYPLTNVKGTIVYDNVSFAFPDANQGVFDLSFEVAAGQTVALVGPTGAGKTTTLALLQRFRDADAGQILIDGHNIRDVTSQSLRSAIAVVFQDAGLFNRSISENILMGNPTASPQDVVDAACLAEAHDFISQKPDGYDCLAGERGQALSAGERQRIAIARALLKNAPILILDEATSALDNETEARVKRAIDALRRDRTTFVIAHRLSTVATADHILVFEKGRIVEQGTFDTLRKSGGLFSRLVEEGGFQSPDPVADP